MNSAANIFSGTNNNPFANLGVPNGIMLSVNDSLAMIGVKNGNSGSALWEHNAASARIGSIVNSEDIAFGVHSSAQFSGDGEVTMVLAMLY